MSALLDFAVTATKTVLQIALVLFMMFTAWAVIVGLAAFIMGVRRYARRHNLSKAYLAGAAVGILTYAVKHRVRPATLVTFVAAGLTAVIGAGITEITSSVLSTTSSRSGNPPPILAPLKKSELEMPTDPPRRLPRSAAPWPPFTGVRVELGEK
jgi:hypothetical protein